MILLFKYPTTLLRRDLYENDERVLSCDHHTPFYMSYSTKNALALPSAKPKSCYVFEDAMPSQRQLARRILNEQTYIKTHTHNSAIDSVLVITAVG